MKAYQDLSTRELEILKAQLAAEYEEVKTKGIQLDMSRGKPESAQLDLSMGMMEVIDRNSVLITENGMDCRNYGGIDGIPEAKKLMADIMEVSPEKVIVYGNSSLSIMYDTISRLVTHGTMGCKPWCKLDKVKFLCPAPGYDRHFAITQHFGIEMITIPMTPNGPDMDMVEKLVTEDEAIKGIWCVPKYSNPQGIVYSDEVVKRFAELRPAAKDFRIFWDNAYAVHHLYNDGQPELLELLQECEKAGNPDMVYEFCSTSKISFSGSGISAMAASPANIAEIKKQLGIQTIGYDKVNQLRHVLFYKDFDGIKAHMQQHAQLLRPKFEAVLKVFHKELGALGIASWISPKGGYFISFEAMEGCAKKIVAKCKEAGVTLTGAGATFPYGIDPMDSNIRIAPTYPTLAEITQAAELFALCVKLVSIEKLIGHCLTHN